MNQKQVPGMDRLTRPQAIALLREHLKALAGDERCACEAAAEHGVFCGGFRDLSDAQFRARFAWIARPRAAASREELEHLVGLYHRGRQEVCGVELCCDAETREHSACDGWNRFDNRALETFCSELTGRSIRIA